jgi:hypothetical protein
MCAHSITARVNVLRVAQRREFARRSSKRACTETFVNTSTTATNLVHVVHERNGASVITTDVRVDEVNLACDDANSRFRGCNDEEEW